MRADVEPEDPQVQQNLAKSVAFVNQAAAATTFVDQELIEHQKTVEAYLTEEDCADYRYPMEETFRTIPHRPDAPTEQLLAQMSELFQNPQKTFKAFVPEFKPVMIRRKRRVLKPGDHEPAASQSGQGNPANRRLSISMKNTAGTRTSSVPR